MNNPNVPTAERQSFASALEAAIGMAERTGGRWQKSYVGALLRNAAPELVYVLEWAQASLDDGVPFRHDQQLRNALAELNAKAKLS